MDDALTDLFHRFDRGLVSRRHLLQALGMAAMAVPLSRLGAQGSCGGENATLPRCNKTAVPDPFPATGWKTVYFDHFKLQCVDPKTEAAYYATLMSWKIRSDDGDKILMDIGDTLGAVEIRGGFPTPPPPPPPPAPAVGDTAGGRGGRGGRGGGGSRQVRCAWDGMCWGIDTWDTKTVEAELTKRGLDPVADHQGRDFQSFHVKDPDGFDVQISNGNARNRRRGPATGKVPAPAPFEPTAWKTLWLDHISFGVSDYKESAKFYELLLGWKPGGDEGSQNTMEISPNFGGIIVRGGNRFAPGFGEGRGGQPFVRRASMGHISFGLAGWDYAKVRDELAKRGLSAREDTGGRGPIATAQYQSYHTTTPNGFDLQISNRTTRQEGGGGA